MSGDVIRAALIADTTDTTAAAIRGFNPGMFATDADVPVWCYQSLKTLLLGTSAVAQDLADAVSPSYGMKLSQTTGVDIVFDSVESVDDPKGMKVDQTGWESGLFLVFARISYPVNAEQAESIKMVHMRIKTLLDVRTRLESGLKPGSLNNYLPAADPIIDPSENYICNFMRFGSVESVLERASIYRASYKLRFPKLA